MSEQSSCKRYIEPNLPPLAKKERYLFELRIFETNRTLVEYFKMFLRRGVDSVDAAMGLLGVENKVFCRTCSPYKKKNYTKARRNYNDLLSRGLITRGAARIVLVPESLGYRLGSFRQWFHHEQEAFDKSYNKENALKANQANSLNQKWESSKMSSKRSKVSSKSNEMVLNDVCFRVNLCFGRILPSSASQNIIWNT